MSVDLNKCVKGQKLITKHGTILTYVCKTEEHPHTLGVSTYYDEAYELGMNSK